MKRTILHIQIEVPNCRFYITVLYIYIIFILVYIHLYLHNIFVLFRFEIMFTRMGHYIKFVKMFNYLYCSMYICLYITFTKIGMDVFDKTCSKRNIGVYEIVLCLFLNLNFLIKSHGMPFRQSNLVSTHIFIYIYIYINILMYSIAY